jgi:hypothetical protein
MSEVNSKMTALAEEVRELSGVTEALSIDAMTTNIGEANDEVSTQVDLIAQLAAALEGKAIGGGGSSSNYQVSVGTAISDGVFVSVEDLPFTPKYVAIFICESNDGATVGLLACAEFGTFDGVDYSSQTEPIGGPGGIGSKTEPAEIELTENGFLAFSSAGRAKAYRYIAIG